jgi:uncharacterized protein YodC (DUF2158 family)
MATTNLRRNKARIGNLVRHKSGGPIMMVDTEPQDSIVGPVPFHCTRVEDGHKKSQRFWPQVLQLVYADGTPRSYDSEQ